MRAPWAARSTARARRTGWWWRRSSRWQWACRRWSSRTAAWEPDPVVVDVLEPEDKVIGGEGMAVAPLHPAAELKGGDLAVGADLPRLGDIRHELGARVVPVEQLVVL